MSKRGWGKILCIDIKEGITTFGLKCYILLTTVFQDHSSPKARGLIDNLICIYIQNYFHISLITNLTFGGGLGMRCLAAHRTGASEPLKISPATLGFYIHSLKPDASGSAIAGSLPLLLE